MSVLVEHAMWREKRDKERKRERESARKREREGENEERERERGKKHDERKGYPLDTDYTHLQV